MTRAAIIQEVDDDPGLTKSELCRRLGLGWGTIDYHVNVLERSLCLKVLRGGSAQVFPGRMPPQHARWLGLLQNEASRRLVCMLIDRPDATRAELKAEVGLTARSVRRIVERLRDAALLDGATLAVSPSARSFMHRVVRHAEVV